MLSGNKLFFWACQLCTAPGLVLSALQFRKCGQLSKTIDAGTGLWTGLQETVIILTGLNAVVQQRSEFNDVRLIMAGF